LLARWAERKGAARLSAIPPELLDLLNRGALPTVNLIEWLALDQARLARALVDDCGIDAVAIEVFLSAAQAARSLPITRRTRALGLALHEASLTAPILASCAAQHRSDMVRAWAALAIGQRPGLDFATRLEQLRPFAADPAMSTREIAWDAWRDHLRADVPGLLPLLLPWVQDPDPAIRRCAIEGSRPRGVWTPHLQALRAQPELGLPLLEPLRQDPSRYVQNAVANWLNDASKDHPDWVQAIARRWQQTSRVPATDFILRRALRSIGKA
jgi:3-methyladenine DNA glycosylase AlkC